MTVVPKNVDNPLVTQAIHHLRQGDVVAIPTETVYGLAADATSDAAIAKIYQTKRRPQFNPLILHFADLAMIPSYVHWSSQADRLAKALWPGPLTLVLPRKAEAPVSLLAAAGLDTLAIRIPSHPLTLSLLEKFKKPLAAPSANPSESLSPTTPDGVRHAFGGHPPFFILEGGPCSGGIESTILDLTQEDNPVILRPGLVTPDQLKTLLGCAPSGDPPQPQGSRLIKAPGQLNRHYAPSIPLRINATSVLPTEALLAFGPHPLRDAARTLNLSAKGSLEEAAANLFAMMRDLDQPEFSGMAVMPLPAEGIGWAIQDRLIRASTPKIN